MSANTEKNKQDGFLAGLDIELMIAQAQAFRPGHACRGPQLPLTYQRRDGPLIWGGMNLHIPLDWDDGVRWLIRMRQVTLSKPPPATLRMNLLSEAATFRRLKEGGAKVPQIWVVPESSMPEGYHYFFVDRLDAQSFEPFDNPGRHRELTDPILKVIKDVAQYYISLEKIHFGSVGSLHFDAGGNIIVGPVIDQIAPKAEAPWYSGPYQTAKERYVAHYTRIMDRILADEWCGADDALYTYLIQLESRTLVEECKELDEGPWYIKAGEPKGDIFMVSDDGHLAAVIDWEWASLTCKAEAFCAPWGFTVPEYDKGDNTLCPFEVALAEVYHKLDRRDLAAFVRGGKKFQRLDWTLHGRWRGYGFMNAFRRAMKDGPPLQQDHEPRSREAWMDNMLERYRDDAGVRALN